MRVDSRIRTLFAAALIACTSFSAEMREQARGRGGEQEPPVKAHVNDVDSSYSRLPLAAEDARYARIDGARLKQSVNDITAISRKAKEEGVKFWGRIAGSKANDEMLAYVERRFREFNISDVRKQPFDLPPQWFPMDWKVTASGGGKTLELKTAFPGSRAAATPVSGLDLDIVWVGAGSDLDFAGRDVKGKVAFISSFPTPSANIHTAATSGALQRAVEKGAAAVLLNIYIPGNVTNFAGGATGIPSFAIGNDDAAQLRALMTAGPVRVHMNLAVEMREGLKDANVWATVPGTTPEEIVVFAHSDGYFEAAFDNASGVATMLALSEYFAAVPAVERKRTLKFVSTAAHHAGSPGTRWMYDNRATAMANTVLVINCEHTAITQQYFQGTALRRSNAINAERWWVHGSDALAALTLDAYKRFGVSVLEGMEPGASGDMGPMGRVIPSIQLITSPVYYHSDHDRASDVPEAGLERVARAFARVIDQVNKLSRAEVTAAPIRPSRER